MAPRDRCPGVVGWDCSAPIGHDGPHTSEECTESFSFGEGGYGSEVYCERREGHDGFHRFLVEWDDRGNEPTWPEATP